MGDAATTTTAATDATSATDTATTATDKGTDAAVTEPLGEDGKKALDAERRARRDAEKAAKTAQKELDDLRASTMNENEKAIAAAKLEGRNAALQETGVKLVDAEVRAAAAGRNVDTDALLESLDRSKFLNADGDPDRAAIVAWIDRIVPPPDEQTTPKPGFPDLSQGTRTATPALGSSPLLDDLKNKLGIR